MATRTISSALGTRLSFRLHRAVNHLNQDCVLALINAGRFQLLAQELVERLVVLQLRAPGGGIPIRLPASGVPGSRCCRCPAAALLCSSFANWLRIPASSVSARFRSGLFSGCVGAHGLELHFVARYLGPQFGDAGDNRPALASGWSNPLFSCTCFSANSAADNSSRSALSCCS